jgi:hypothetical protein
MTPADRTSVRGRSQAGEAVPAPVPPSPKHTDHDCAECARLAEQAQAASITRDRSRLTDIAVLFARHLGTGVAA